MIAKGLAGYRSMVITQGYGDLGKIYRRVIKLISRTNELVKAKSRIDK